MVDQAAEFPLTAMVWLERPERIDRGGIPMKRFLGVILMCAMLLFTAAMAEHSSPIMSMRPAMASFIMSWKAGRCSVLVPEKPSSI